MASNEEVNKERESEEDAAVSMVDVLQEEQQLEDDANAVLGDSDDKECTYNKGYVPRQALYACATCDPASEKPAGVCLACSLECHDGHQLFELYTKRNFRCDCGNSKFGDFKCKLCPEKDATNGDNCHNQNFQGLYCSCSRPYPDPEDEVEDEMIQCVVCEDWHHGRHLGSEVPANNQYDEMICAGCMERCEFLWAYSTLCTGRPKIVPEAEKLERMKKCHACLSTLLHLNNVATPDEKRQEMIQLVQQLVDAKVGAAEFEKQARFLLKAQADPFLEPFLMSSLLAVRWSLNQGKAKLEGIMAPADNIPMKAPEQLAAGEGLENAAVGQDETLVQTCVDFLSTIMELAAQLGNETHTALVQSIQQLLNNTMSPEDFHKKLNELLTMEPSTYLTPLLESGLPRLRWSLLNSGEQLTDIQPPPPSVPVDAAPKENIEKPESNAEADTTCRLKLAKTDDTDRWQGAAFWPENWRTQLCQCDECKKLYSTLRASFLLDVGDTIHAYEERGKQRVAPLNQYEKGMHALSAMDRVQQVEVLHEYNDLKSELSEYLKKFAESGKVVREEDIREFFGDLQARKRQKTSGGMQYFCK